MPDRLPFDAGCFRSERLEALPFAMDGRLGDADLVHRQAGTDRLAGQNVATSSQMLSPIGEPKASRCVEAAPIPVAPSQA
jgi:hypothetical protein